jgi:hypothetical protein
VCVPIGSGWVATDVIKVTEIATGSGVTLATRYLAFFGALPGPFDCLAGCATLRMTRGTCGARCRAIRCPLGGRRNCPSHAAFVQCLTLGGYNQIASVDFGFEQRRYLTYPRPLHDAVADLPDRKSELALPRR